MVKAGIYLLARMHPALSGTAGWLWTLTILGAATAVFASLQSLRQTDLKQALAYTTLMALGTLTLLLGQDSGYAMTAFATFLIVHSLYKAALFLVVGNIDAATGTREVAELGGLGPAMKLTAAAAALAALSMAGAPPFLGFIGKELKYAGALAAETPLLVAGALVLANALMFAVAGVVALRPFWRGDSWALPRAPKERSWRMLAGPVVLGVAGTLFGIFPEPLQQALVTPTVAALTGDAANAAELTLWHGVNLPLLLSLATFALGLVLYLGHGALRTGLGYTLGLLPDLDRGWDRFLDGLKGFAEWQAARIQSGRLSFYLAATFGTVAGALLVTMLARGLPLPALTLDGFSWAPGMVAALMLAGGLLVLLTRSRITAIAGLGTSGIAISLVFLIYGAPDVAITQLLVETLVVVLVAVALLKLPRLPAPRFRPGAAVISGAVGASVSLMLLSVLGQPLDLSLTSYFEATSYPDAHGRNIVNVILVDFRAIDTFGEIAVVAIAALSALALLRGTKGRTR